MFTTLTLYFLVIFLLSIIILALYNSKTFCYSDLKKATTWLKAIMLSFPIFLVVNALIQSGVYSNIDFGETFSTLPNYLDLFVTMVTAYLLFLTLNSQNRYNKIASFESRFFKFMDYHRENVLSMEYRDPRFKDEKYRKGSEVFTVLFYEMRDLILQIQSHSSHATNSQQAEIIDFAYQCIFHGAGKDGMAVLNRQFPNSPYFDLINFKDKKAKYASKKRVDVYYSGNMRRLGHYFRNIYQAISYVEDQSFLSENEKYEYVSHFRAQMTVYEQAIFFLNSLSASGKVWEYEEYANHDLRDFNAKRKVFNKLWITKYDLIRNIPNIQGEILENIFVKDFYPLLTLEREKESTVSGRLNFKQPISVCRYCFNSKYIGYVNRNPENKIYEALAKDKDAFQNFICEEDKCKTKEYLAILKKPRALTK